MKIVPSLRIPDVKFIIPDVHNDSRGSFFECYNSINYRELIKDVQTYKDFTNEIFFQDNISYNEKIGTIRGMHWQIPPYEQGKLVQVLQGKVLDIAVDIRKESPTFGQFVEKILCSKKHHQMWIPPGFAHGFQVLENNTTFHYKCTKAYSTQHSRSFRFNSETLDLPWFEDYKPILSKQDESADCFYKGGSDLFLR